jgi:hypothetical protein
MLLNAATQEPMATYQERAEAFWQEEVRARYRAEAGLASELSLSATYQTYADLFSKEQVRSLVAQAQTQTSSMTRYLAEFAAMRYLQNASAAHDERFFVQLGESTVTWDGQKVPFFATTSLLAAESDAERRRDLYEKRSRLVERFNDNRWHRWQAIYEALPPLGFETYYALCNELRGLRLAGLRCLAESFLAETAVPYFNDLKRWGESILGTSDVDAADMYYLLRAAQFDHLFPAERLETVIHEAALALGINLKKQTALEMDLESRPGKSPRPFCAFVRVPDEIKLVINPLGGHSDYRNAFHELGHALHGLHINRDLPFVARYLGDDSVGEAFAFLCERLISEPVWLRQFMGIEAEAEFVRYMRFINLLFIRRCAVKVIYESQLHTTMTEEEPQKLYAALLQEHLGLNISPAYYLMDVDDGFYDAQYFRAWMLTARIRERLRDRFGDDWVATPATGAFLRPLWETGQQSAEMLSLQLNADSLNPDALIQMLLS